MLMNIQIKLQNKEFNIYKVILNKKRHIKIRTLLL